MSRHSSSSLHELIELQLDGPTVLMALLEIGRAASSKTGLHFFMDLSWQRDSNPFISSTCLRRL